MMAYERNAAEDKLRCDSFQRDNADRDWVDDSLAAIGLYWITRAVEAEAERDKLRNHLSVVMALDHGPLHGFAGKQAQCICVAHSDARAALTPTAKELTND